MNPFPRRHPETAFRAIGDEGGMVVLSGRSEVNVLNPVGIKIFSLLDGKHSNDDIVREVVADFDVAEEQARNELVTFLDDLAADGMLAEAEQAGTLEVER